MHNIAYETKEIQDMLLEIGMPAHLSGFTYLTTAIQFSLNDPAVLHHIVRQIYSGVGVRHGASPESVERAMRHAIGVTWTQGNVDYINSIFKYSVNPMRGCPTNSQFIATMYYYLNTAKVYKVGAL